MGTNKATHVATKNTTHVAAKNTTHVATKNTPHVGMSKKTDASTRTHVGAHSLGLGGTVVGRAMLPVGTTQNTHVGTRTKTHVGAHSSG